MSEFLQPLAPPLSANELDLEHLAETLARDFLALEREGCVRNASICLFGSDLHVMSFLARSMGVRFRRAGRLGLQVECQRWPEGNACEKYAIDVDYFLKAPHLLKRD